MDGDWYLFELLGRAIGSDRISSLRHDAIHHKPKLDHSHSSRGMHGEL